MEMLFIVTLFAAITKTRFSGLKWSSATNLFDTQRKFDVNLPKTPSFCKKRFFHRKQSSFHGHYVPFAKGSERKFLSLFSYTHTSDPVEATMNDRPLTHIFCEPHESEAITPSHLLYGRRIVTLPCGEPLDIQVFPKSDSVTVERRCKFINHTIEQFRDRWKYEYLTALREHYSKSTHPSKTIKVGDVVQIHDDKPRIQWKLGVVDELLTGNDGITRAVKLRTNSGYTNRLVVKLYPLEITNTNAVVFTDVHWSSAIKLSEYVGYKSVALLSYKIPDQTAQTVINLEARTIGDNCNFEEVYIYLQHGGYPLAFPYNETFPDHFYINKTDAYHLKLEKNKGMSQIIMSNPKAGQWYFAAFLPKPKTDKIEQKGFNQKCMFGMFIVVESQGFDDVQEIPLEKSNHVHLKQDMEKRSVLYRFILPEDTAMLSLHIDNCSTKFLKDNQVLNVSQSSLTINATMSPTGGNTTNMSELLFETLSQEVSTASPNLSSSSSLASPACPVIMTTDFEELPSVNSKHIKNCTNQSNCHISVMSPTVGQWVYVQVALDPKYGVEEMTLRLKVKAKRCESLKLVVPRTILEVFRSTRTSENITRNLAQDTCLLIDSLGRYVWMDNTFNLTFLRAEKAVVPLQAPLRDLHIPEHTVVVMNFRIEEMTDIGGTLKFYSEFFNNTVESVDQYTGIHLCLLKQRIPGGETIRTCDDGVHHLLNTSSKLSKVTYIPYPESGVWFLGVVSQCVHKHTGLPVKCDREPQINLDLTISGCVDSQCGRYGRCRDYISGVHVFSACDCIAGWRGYGCTDGREARSDQEELLAVLLLTLSNLFFIPAITLAIYRKFYVEALVYAYTMFFSTFYHACDASNLIYYCMFKYDVLSFADFLGSISSFLVTMLAMADLGAHPRSFAHVMGVLGVAVGVEYDRHGLLVFAVPAGLAAAIMFLSWGFRCKKERKLFPSKRYFLIHLLPGLLLAIAGLVLFAFLETKENYKITHSLWHVAMSTSIVFLLPNRKEKDVLSKDLDMVSADGFSTNADTVGPPLVL